MGDIFDSGSTCSRCDRKSTFDICSACEREGWRTQISLIREIGAEKYYLLLQEGKIEEGKSLTEWNPSWVFVRRK